MVRSAAVAEVDVGQLLVGEEVLDDIDVHVEAGYPMDHAQVGDRVGSRYVPGGCRAAAGEGGRGPGDCGDDGEGQSDGQDGRGDAGRIASSWCFLQVFGGGGPVGVFSRHPSFVWSTKTVA